MTNKFTTELRARGLQITDKEADKLALMAVAQFRENLCKPVLKRDRAILYLILGISLTDALYELLYMIEEGDLKYKFKRDFKVLKRSALDVVQEFERINKEDPALMDAYKAFSEDFCEMVYQFLDNINQRQ